MFRRYTALLLSFIVAIAALLLTAYAAGAAPAALQYTSVTCSSQYSSAYQCSYAVDGDTGTEWASNGEGTSAWIQFDLSGGAVQRLRYYGRAVDCWYWPYLEFDDGTIIDLPGGNGGCNGWHDYILPEPVTGKQWVKVRLEATGGSGNSGFKEVELYDTGTFVEDADNLAYLSQIVPCSQHHVHTYNARRSIDFDDATTWAPAATDTDQPFWVEYTFPWQQTVGSVAILGRYTGDATGFGIPRLRLSSGLVITGSEYISSNHWITVPLPVATGAISIEIASMTTWPSWPTVHRPGIQSIRILSAGAGSYPTSTWDAGAWIYYPLTQADEWSHYQTYSDTTWYGTTYQYYNIWRARPGATAYSIATLDITDVGVNQFGYYVEAQINVWPDVQSTTLRYEGLQTVLVAPGQRIGPQCEIGKIAPNSRLYGEYHLLLGVFFPDVSTPFNPYPYMGKRPVPGMCVPVDPGGELPPSGIPNYPFAVCQECQPPTTWTNFGRWIVWLECMIQNLFLCYLLEWLNGIIAVQILALQHAMATGNAMMLQFNGVIGTLALIYGRLAETGAWGAEPINAGLSWLNGIATSSTTYLSGWGDYLSGQWNNTTAQIENLIAAVQNIGGSIGVTILDPGEGGGGGGTNIWDVLLEITKLLRDLLSGILSLMYRIFDFAAGVFNILLMLLSGTISGITDTTSVDLLDFALTGELNETGGDAGTMGIMGMGGSPFEGQLCGDPAGAIWSVNGPSLAKGICMFIGGMLLADKFALEIGMIYIFFVVNGLIAIGVIVWIFSKVRELVPLQGS